MSGVEQLRLAGTARPVVDDAFGHWLAGFLDGEACFQVTEQSRDRGQYTCSLSVALRDDDLPLLNEIMAYTGVGHIVRSNRAVLRIPGANPQATWRVANKAGLLVIVEILDRCPLRSKKSREYPHWREAVVAWAAYKQRRGNQWYKRPADTATWDLMADCKRRIETIRKYDAERAAA